MTYQKEKDMTSRGHVFFQKVKGRRENMSSSRPIDNPKDPRTDEKPVFSKELVQEDLKDEFKSRLQLRMVR